MPSELSDHEVDYLADAPKGAKRKGSGASKAKRKADALLPGAKRARRGGGICLSDEEDEPSIARVPVADGPEEEGGGEDEGEDEASASGDKAAGTAAHKSGGTAQEEAKPKPKSAMDDLWEEMKRGETVKKAAPAPKTDISSFINGLVSKSSSSGAASKGGKFDVASLFPTSVTKKQTVKVCYSDIYR